MKKFLIIPFLSALLSGPAAVAQGPTPDFSLVGYATMAGGTTGGAGGTSITVSTGTALQAAIKNKGSQPLTIYINGTITPANSPGLSKIDVKEKNDISILGVGTSGEFNGIGIKVFRANNIIIRNVTVHQVLLGDKDCISIEGPASHIWVDHCDLYNVLQGVDKDYYDALLDAKKDAEYITFSWNYLHDSWKASLSGYTESDLFDRKITYHHNYFRNINSRLPLFRGGQGHVFNNYYKDIESTAINSRLNACLKIENNYFENSQNPYVSAYSNVRGYGDIVGNTLINSPFVYSSDTYLLQPCTLTIPYAYATALESAATVPASVVANAGVGILDITGDGSNPNVTYQLTASATGQGTVTPTSTTINQGETVTLTASAATGWRFTGWSGDATGTTNPLPVVMNGNKTIVATFEPGTSMPTPGATIRIEDSDTPTTGLCAYDGAIADNAAADNGKVINLSNSAAKGATWKVEVASAGTYTLKWRYVHGSSATATQAKLLVNDATVTTELAFPKTANKTTFTTTSTEVTLVRGVNQVRMETLQSGEFADLDWLEVSGSSMVASNCANAVGTVVVLANGARQQVAGLVKAYPNPANGITTFEINLPKNSQVAIRLFDTKGRKVADVASPGQLYSAGIHSLTYNTKALAAGVYFYLVETSSGVQREKLLVQ